MIDLSKTRKFIKDVLVGVTGASVAQVLSFLLVPIVARLFSPDDFGSAATFLAVFTVLSTFASLRFEQAIILPKTEEDAKALSCIALRILVGVTLISTMAVLMIPILLASTFKDYDLTLWVILLPLFLLISGSANILLSWNNRMKHYPRIAVADVTSTLGTSIPRIGFGFVFGSSVLGLLLGNLIGQITRVVVLWKGIKNKDGTTGISCKLPSGSAKRMMTEYRDFPLYFAPTDLVRELKENIPLFAITILFTIQAAGFYAMAMRLLRLPIAVISMPVRRVYVQRAADAFKADKAIRGLLLKATGLLLVTGIPPFFILSLYGSDIFYLLLGANWEVAGIYAETISVWLFSIFVLTPSSATLMVMRKRRTWLFFQIVGALIGGLVFLGAGLLSLSELQMLTAFSLSQASLNAAMFLAALHVAPR